MRVRAIAVGHLVDSGGEQIVADEDVGVFGEEAEDQPRHEVVHVVAALRPAPFGVVLQELDIEPVEPSCRLDVEGAFADLFDSRDARKRQEKAEVIGEVGIVADDDFSGGQVFRLKLGAIGSQDELRLGARGCPACPQGSEGLGHRARGAGFDVDVAGLKDAAKVGLVRAARSQALDGRGLVPEGFQEGIRELFGVVRRCRERGNGFFNLDGVHSFPLPCCSCADVGNDSTLILAARFITWAYS